MEEKIIHYLEQIEEEKDVKILLACETGSRAWGFPSPDSDFDVRILYVHKKDWYLSLSENKDTVDRMFENNDIDIVGWDLKKSLMLLKKSNAALLERIQSPILYKSNTTFLSELKHHASVNYSRIATIHHYLSMAKSFKEELHEKEYKLKKFFYALRSAVACKWILEKEEIPPIEFPKMMDGLKVEPTLRNRIDQLIEIKSTKSESYFHKGEREILNFIESCIIEAEDKRKSLPASKGNMKDLNTFFIKSLNHYDN